MTDDKKTSKHVEQREGESAKLGRLFKIEDTPENVARAPFELNTNREGFEWNYLKQSNIKGEYRADDLVP